MPVDLYYPIPNLTNGVQDLLTYQNTVTNNWFAPLILVAIFLILFIGMKTRNIKTEHAFVSSSFSITLITYIMSLIPGFISSELIVITTMITAVSVIFLYRSDSGNSI